MALMFSTALQSANHELLQSTDVNKIMKQIFDQHVDKKEISDSIIKKSLKVYIDQFDPDRIYLTEEQVSPFLKLSDTKLAGIMQQYQKNQFPEYQDLNNVIQESIIRARQIREQIERDQKSQLFQNSSTLAVDGYEDWSDPDLKRSFVKNETQLKERIQQHLIQFIANERKRYGEAPILSHQNQTLQILEKRMHEHENQYLFVLENGQPMIEAEKQNALFMHILKSLANSLDSHTTIMNPVEANDMRIRLEKEIDGIGLLLQSTADGSFIVSQLIEGGPAAKSGLIKLGDQVLEIDGHLLQKMPAEHVMELIRGKNGSKTTLVVKRIIEENLIKSNKIFNVQLVREATHINEDRTQVGYETFGNGIIGKIKLDTFYQSDNGITSENDVRDAIKKLDRQGNLLALVLDFRENSGGFLSQAVKVAGLFITNGVVVISKYFNGEEHFYRDMDGKIAYDGPLIILTSKATASAAEIVAQALQDYGVAIIVGDEHTYGKGTIQSQTVTENQGSTYFKVTVGKYYTVSGKTPQIQGVKADVIVPSQFAHENIGEEYLDYPLQQDVIPPAFEDKLEDIASNSKSWYMKYYVPTIQHRKDLWRSMIPSLKKNSEYRISHNQNFQIFLKGFDPNASFLTTKARVKNAGIEDLQMGEAVNIAKDMIVLHSKQRHGDPLEQTAAIPAGAFPNAEK